eukprot:PhM_4_TR4985/c0_g1_i1/m.85375
MVSASAILDLRAPRVTSSVPAQPPTWYAAITANAVMGAPGLGCANVFPSTLVQRATSLACAGSTASATPQVRAPATGTGTGKSAIHAARAGPAATATFSASTELLMVRCASATKTSAPPTARCSVPPVPVGSCAPAMGSVSGAATRTVCANVLRAGRARRVGAPCSSARPTPHTPCTLRVTTKPATASATPSTTAMRRSASSVRAGSTTGQRAKRRVRVKGTVCATRLGVVPVTPMTYGGTGPAATAARARLATWAHCAISVSSCRRRQPPCRTRTATALLRSKVVAPSWWTRGAGFSSQLGATAPR